MKNKKILYTAFVIFVGLLIGISGSYIKRTTELIGTKLMDLLFSFSNSLPNNSAVEKVLINTLIALAIIQIFLIVAARKPWLDDDATKAIILIALFGGVFPGFFMGMSVALGYNLLLGILIMAAGILGIPSFVLLAKLVSEKLGIKGWKAAGRFMIISSTAMVIIGIFFFFFGGKGEGYNIGIPGIVLVLLFISATEYRNPTQNGQTEIKYFVAG